MDSTSPATGDRRALAAVLLMQAAMTVFDTYSTLNSSPWTAENVGADPEKVASLKEYVTHAAVFSTGICLVSASVARSSVPVWGALLANGYLIWIYRRAVKRGQASGSTGQGWFDQWGGKSA